MDILNIPTKHIIIICVMAVIISLLTLLITGPIQLIANTTMFVAYIIVIGYLVTRKEKQKDMKKDIMGDTNVEQIIK